MTALPLPLKTPTDSPAGRARLFASLILAVSFLGLLDTSYLVAKRLLGGPVKCFLVEGCDTVTTSQYSLIFGVIPVAWLGFLFYLTVFFITFGYLETGWPRLKQAVLGLSVTGLAVSVWFTYVQAAIISAYCTYCLVSAATSTFIFILVVLLFRQKSN